MFVYYKCCGLPQETKCCTRYKLWLMSDLSLFSLNWSLISLQGSSNLCLSGSFHLSWIRRLQVSILLLVHLFLHSLCKWVISYYGPFYYLEFNIKSLDNHRLVTFYKRLTRFLKAVWLNVEIGIWKWKGTNEKENKLKDKQNTREFFRHSMIH